MEGFVRVTVRNVLLVVEKPSNQELLGMDGQMDGERVGRGERHEVGGGVEAIPSTPLSHKYGKGTARLSQPSYEQNVILLPWQGEEALS